MQVIMIYIPDDIARGIEEHIVGGKSDFNSHGPLTLRAQHRCRCDLLAYRFRTFDNKFVYRGGCLFTIQ
jgi:hypothetical protein